MSDDAGFTQFKLRLPNDLKVRLEQASQGSGRSISAEIITRLNRTFVDVNSLLVRNRLLELNQIEHEIPGAEHRISALRTLRDSVPDHPKLDTIHEELRANIDQLERLLQLREKLRADLGRLTADLAARDGSFPGQSDTERGSE